MNRTLPHWMIATSGLALLGLAIHWTLDANRRDFIQTENLLSLQAQTLARHVNAWKPEYTAHFQRVVSSNPGHLRVLLYDLSGWEIGRAGGSGAALPLNQRAARSAAPHFLRPLNNEKPLPSFSPIPSEILNHSRVYNRLYASNIIGGAWVETLDSDNGDSWLVATTAVNDYDSGANRSFISAWLQAAMRIDDATRPLQQRWWRLAGVSATLAGLAAGWIWLSRRETHSLRTAATSAERIPNDKLQTARLEEPLHNPEALRLVRACNRLLDRVAEIHLAQQRFVANAAHELRTPLTILRGEIQVALREPSNHPFLLQTLRSNLDEAVHLSKLVDSLLTLARADAGQILAAHKPVDLPALSRQSLEKLNPLAAKHSVRLSVQLPKDPIDPMPGDEIALGRVLFNLLENAILHSPANHEVAIQLSSSSAHWIVAVQDHGIGIGPEHLPKLFDRFYRVDAARRRSDGGAGLGLAIVKTLVEAHRGTVEVQSEVGVGTTFTLRFPRA